MSLARARIQTSALTMRPPCLPTMMKRRIFYFTTIATNLVIWLANLPVLIKVQTMLLMSSVKQCLFQLTLKKHFPWRWYWRKIQIEMWFRVVCNLINDDKCYHKGQNLLWTHLTAPHKSPTFWSPVDHYDNVCHILPVRVHHIRFVKFPQQSEFCHTDGLLCFANCLKKKLSFVPGG